MVQHLGGVLLQDKKQAAESSYIEVTALKEAGVYILLQILKTSPPLYWQLEKLPQNLTRVSAQKEK